MSNLPNQTPAPDLGYGAMTLAVVAVAATLGVVGLIAYVAVRVVA